MLNQFQQANLKEIAIGVFSKVFAFLAIFVVIGLLLVGLQGCNLRPLVAERQKAIQARMETIEAKRKPPEVIRTAAQGEELARDANYLAAQRISTERAAIFHKGLAAGLDLNAEETKQFLVILESAHQGRLKSTDFVVKQGSNFRKEFIKQVERRTLPEEIERDSPVHTNEKLRELLGAERFEVYLRLRDIAFASEVPFPFQGTLVVTEDRELDSEIYGHVEIAADNVTLDCRNNPIHSSRDAPWGIIIENRSNVTLYSCLVYNHDIGIYISDSTGIHVEDSYAAINGVGYRIEDSSNIDIVRSAAVSNVGEGFATRRTTHAFFWESRAVQNGGDGFDENDGANAYYLRNHAINNGTNGFELDFGPAATFWQNRVWTNGQHGISLDAINGALVPRQ